jgi:carboxymethylenebutenolidase
MTDDPQRPEYARAAGPVAERTVIRTGADGLDTEHLHVTATDAFAVPVYVARPVGVTGLLPVIAVISEAFGLHAHIEDIARRFAHQGYLAIAPDLMKRQGDPQTYPDVDSLVTDLLQQIPDDQVMADLDDVVDWAIDNGGDAERVAATGFCWGGRWTWLFAAHRRLAAAVAWYGILDGRASGAYPNEDLFPRHPIDIAPALHTPTLGLYGAMDDAIPLGTVEAMKEALQQGDPSRSESQVVVYPDAGHAFFADYRETYVDAAARDAWSRALHWLREHGV